MFENSKKLLLFFQLFFIENLHAVLLWFSTAWVVPGTSVANISRSFLSWILLMIHLTSFYEETSRVHWVGMRADFSPLKKEQLFSTKNEQHCLPCSVLWKIIQYTSLNLGVSIQPKNYISREQLKPKLVKIRNSNLKLISQKLPKLSKPIW